MNSRAAILERIRNNKPPSVSLPDLSVFQHDVKKDQLIKDFIRTSTGNMSNVINVVDSEIPAGEYLKKFISENYPEASLYNTLDKTALPDEFDFRESTADLFIAEANFGVAENGCLWLDESILTQRISPFACQHTLLLIDHKNLVPTMHQAYGKININETGYGVFIAGPSKTADIEQSLVVGAQGAVSNTIIII